jgi:hypothetical protein
MSEVSKTTIPPLDPDIVGPLREADPAPPAVRARARERLLTAVAGLAGQAGQGRQGGQGGQSGPGGGGVGVGPQGRSGLLSMSGTVAFLLGGVVGAGLYAAMAPAPEPRVVYVDRAAPAPVPAPVAAAPTVPVTAPTEEPRAQAVTSPASAAPSARESQLSAERVLLDEARAALAQGDPARAIDRLQRHRRTFTAPILGEERDAMWIQALVKEGRYDEARASAAAFRKRSPDSLFSSVVDSAIDSIP